MPAVSLARAAAARTIAADPPFTRREGDQLARRLEEIDQHGTRGMQLLQQQTTANTGALGELRNEITTRFAEHTRQHERELKALYARRRWRITAAVAAVTAAAGMLSLMLSIAVQLSRLHG